MGRVLLVTGLCAGLACFTMPALANGQKSASTDSCSACHANLSGKLGEQARAFRSGDVHAAAGLDCAACHGGDAAARDANGAHAGAGFTARPALGADAVVALCGRCHAEPARNFLQGPHHLASAPRKPDCTTCHGTHSVKPASIGMIAEPLCSSCHTVAQARRIQKALGDAESEVAALDAGLASDRQSAPERARLMTARSQLRGLSHALDLMAITRAAAQTLATVDEVRAKVEPRMAANAWPPGLQTAALALAAMLTAMAVIWLARALVTGHLRVPIPRGKPLLLLAGIVGVLGLLASIIGYRGYRYIQHDPKFCTSCHTMNSAFSLWQQSGHKNVECHACHTPNVVANLHQLWVYATRQPDVVVKHAEIDRAICEQCHAGGGNASKWNRIVESPGHRVHSGKQRIECVQCHGMSVHRFVPPKETCATCHKKVTLVAAGSMAEMHCLGCHPFAAADGKRPLKPDRAVCLDCHGIRQVGSEVFPAGKTPMKWDCGKCHKPHERMYIGTQDCKKCHEAVNEGIHRVKAHAECLQCHKPHGWAAQVESCTNCHAGIAAGKHHASAGKTCKDCHGAWDDEFQGPQAAKAKMRAQAKGPAKAKAATP